MDLDVIVSGASMRVERVPLGAADTDGFLEFLSQVSLLMNQFLISSETVVGPPMRIPDVSLTALAFFSDNVTTQSMLTNLTLLEIGSTSTLDGSMRAHLIVLACFIVSEEFRTSLVSTGEFGRIQNLMSETMNLTESDIFTSQRTCVGFRPILTRSSTGSSSLPRVFNPLIYTITAKSSLACAALLGLG
jgi:hypothetical protein